MVHTNSGGVACGCRCAIPWRVKEAEFLADAEPGRRLPVGSISRMVRAMLDILAGDAGGRRQARYRKVYLRSTFSGQSL